MFKPHHSYTHKRMLDLVAYVFTSYRVNDGRYKLKVRWFTRSGLDLGIVEKITILPGKNKGWHEYVG